MIRGWLRADRNVFLVRRWQSGRLDAGFG